MVNLIDQRRAEGELERHIWGVHQTASLPGVAYTAFDFHK